MRRWGTALLAVLVVVDLVVLVLGFRAREGHLPPLQRGAGASFEVPTASASETADPTADADLIQAPVLLGANKSGLVLRATRGACEERFDNPAHFWTGNLDDVDGLQPLEVPTLLEVLGLIVLDDGTMRMSGLDEACQLATVVSSDEGVTWRSSPSAEVWRLSSDTQAAAVTGPAGATIDLDCAPSQLVNLPGRRGIASCPTETFYLLRVGRQDPASLSAAGFEDLSVTPTPDGKAYYALGGTDKCLAQVATVVPEEDSPALGECLPEDRAPLAITTAGDRVVVQVGADLMVSEDEGDSFTLVGPAQPATTETPTDTASG
jgi:hypothetical protein